MKSEKSYILCIYRGKKIYNEFNKGIIWKKNGYYNYEF